MKGITFRTLQRCGLRQYFYICLSLLMLLTVVYLSNTAKGQAQGQTVCYNLDLNWGTGFQSSVKITNNGPGTVQNWQVEFDFPHNITSIWDARVISRVGNHYTIGNAGWNANIAPGSAVSFGFNGSPNGPLTEPTNFKLNGAPVSCGGSPTPTPTPTPTPSPSPTPTPSPSPTPPTCVTATSGGGFQNRPFVNQTGTFTAEFDATPSVAPINSIVGLSNGPKTAHTGFAAIARFNPSGNIDARNGGAYAAASTIPYTAGVTYHFRLVVNIPAHTYSIFVRPAGGTERTVGSNFAFRTEQNTVTSLNNFAVWVNTTPAGSTAVCNFTTSAGCSFSISPTSQSFTSAGGTGSVSVTASSPTCAWTNTSNASFITVTSGSGGTGNGTVNYSVSPNTGAARSGTITIAGNTFTVNQGAASGNNPPAFTSNPIVKPNATVNQPYSSSIAGDATDPDNDPLTFSKVSGPGWLTVSSSGALSGTPGSANVGLNTFTVSVADNRGGSANGTLNITVQTADTNCNLPRRLIVGYWQNFSNGSTFFRVGQVSNDYDVINVAFALPTSNTDMRMQFVPESRLYSSNQDFIADVNALHNRGKRVVISVGGATGIIDLSTDQQRTDFTNSMINMIRTFGFDGIDIDFEGGAFLRNPNDNDFENPTTPRIVNAIRAIRDIRNAFSGQCFILSFAPETFFLQAAFDSYESAGFTTRGGYVPVINALRGITTYVHAQHYNTGSMFGLDNNIYENGGSSSDSQRSDFHVAMAEILLRGFPVGRNPNKFFQPLREDQVIIGLPASTQAAGSGFTSVSAVQNSVRYLVQRTSYPGRQYTLQKPTGAYPNFRGLMTWSVNWDAFVNFEFSRNHRTFLNSLP